MVQIKRGTAFVRVPVSGNFGYMSAGSAQSGAMMKKTVDYRNLRGFNYTQPDAVNDRDF